MLDEQGRPYVSLGQAVTGCDDVPVYSCPVALAREPWVRQVLAAHRVESIPRLLDQHMPTHPSAAFVQAMDYTRAEVSRLHTAQTDRLRKEKP